MKKIILLNIILGKSKMSLLLLISPLIFCVISLFIQITFFGKIEGIPIATIFYPFLYLWLIIFWMEVLLEEFMSRIDFNPILKINFLRKFIKLSKWSLLGLSLFTTILILSNNFILFEVQWIKYLINLVAVPFLLLMLFSFITFYYGRNVLGKLLIVVETQRPFDKNDNGHQNFESIIGNMIPFGYLKMQKRIKKIITDDKPHT